MSSDFGIGHFIVFAAVAIILYLMIAAGVVALSKFISNPVTCLVVVVVLIAGAAGTVCLLFKFVRWIVRWVISCAIWIIWIVSSILK